MHSGTVPDPAERRLTRQITLICEVLTEPGGEGRVVGRVQVVTTGELVLIADVGDLVTLVRRLSRAESALTD